MRTMTPAECRAFLLEGARTAKLATVRADVRPHIAPIWLTLDGDDLLVTSWHTGVKAANIRRDGHPALCVDDNTPPFSYVITFYSPWQARLPSAIKAVAPLSNSPSKSSEVPARAT